jgi:hypothetical protein
VEDHLLSSVNDCLLNILAASWRPSLRPQHEDSPYREDKGPKQHGEVQSQEVEVEVEVEVSNRFAALEDLDTEVDSALKCNRENIKMSVK